MIKTKPKREEQALVKAICEYCHYRKIPFIHIRNTGAIAIKNGKPSFIKPWVPNRGVPDLVVGYRGRVTAIECKAPTGRQSKEQSEWQRVWEAHTLKYQIVRTFEQFLSLLNIS